MVLEESLVVLKPDALRRGLVGRILQRFEEADLQILELSTRSLDNAFVRLHYPLLSEQRGERALHLTEVYMTSGPVIACRIGGIEAVRNCRKLIGSTMPTDAAPGTIRGDFGHMSEEGALARNEAVMNLVHASGTLQEARSELALWFPDQ